MTLNQPCYFDDFLEDYTAVLNFMSGVKFSTAPRYNFPGERSDLFCHINIDLQNQISKQLVALDERLGKYRIDVSFQRIFGYQDEILSGGWVHTDGGPKYSGILYLNQNADPKTGTTFCEAKLSSYDPNANLKLRNYYYKQFHEDPSSVNVEAYRKAKEIHNDRFVDSYVVENKFNRLVMFPSNLPHKQNSFGGNNYIRYTMVMFFYEEHPDDGK